MCIYTRVNIMYVYKEFYNTVSAHDANLSQFISNM